MPLHESTLSRLISLTATILAAFFYQIKENPNNSEEIENIVKHFNDLNEVTDSVTLPYTFSLHALIGNINTDRFYTYRGRISRIYYDVIYHVHNCRLTHNTEMQWSSHLDDFPRHHSNLIESNGKVSITFEWNRRTVACWQLPTSAANWKSKDIRPFHFLSHHGTRQARLGWEGKWRVIAFWMVLQLKCNLLIYEMQNKSVHETIYSTSTWWQFTCIVMFYDDVEWYFSVMLSWNIIKLTRKLLHGYDLYCYVKIMLYTYTHIYAC